MNNTHKTRASRLSTNIGEVKQKRLPPLIYYAIIIYALYMPVYMIIDPSSIIRNFLYIIPIIIFIESIRGGIISINNLFLFILITYIASNLSRIGRAPDEIKEFLFISSSLSIFVLSFRSCRATPTILLASAGALAAPGIPMLFAGFEGMAVLRSATFQSESAFGLVAPLIGIVFYVQKKYIMFAVSIIISLLLFKRIALGACVIVILFDILILKYREVSNFNTIIFKLLVFIILITSIIFCLNSVVMYEFASDLLYNWLNVRISADDLSSGRYFATMVFSDALAARETIWSDLFGFGPGASTVLLSEIPELLDKNFPLLHNDILRIRVDYGFIGLGAVIFGMWKMLNGKRITVLAALYTLFLFMTDNVASYLLYWLAFAFLLRVIFKRADVEDIR